MQPVSGEHVIKQELSLAERRDRALRHLNEVFAEPPVIVGGSNASGGKVNGHAHD
jgi:hypothetical protein